MPFKNVKLYNTVLETNSITLASLRAAAKKYGPINIGMGLRLFEHTKKACLILEKYSEPGIGVSMHVQPDRSQ